MPGPIGNRPVSLPTTSNTTEPEGVAPEAEVEHHGHSPAATGSHLSTVTEGVLEQGLHKLEHIVEHTKADAMKAARRAAGNMPKAGTKAKAKYLKNLKALKNDAKALTAGSKAAQASKIFKMGEKALGVAGPVLNGVWQYGESTSTTTAGKTINAIGAGAVDGVLTKAVPVVAAVDAAASLILPEETMRKAGGGIGGTLNTSVRAITTVGEGIVTGDTRGMENFHEKSMKGDYGVVFQAASEAGEYWAEHGVVGGLKNAWSAIWD